MESQEIGVRNNKGKDCQGILNNGRGLVDRIEILPFLVTAIFVQEVGITKTMSTNTLKKMLPNLFLVLLEFK